MYILEEEENGGPPSGWCTAVNGAQVDAAAVGAFVLEIHETQ